eukprot:CAMPEP_0203005732 /NCGR_PEP_ID=MMETSP1401-20130829/3158_1 /ASSEMBLY_ACC=CAM_ASM_000894 /TAXON_ID=38833 /ORGANISM="Micromonas pusilla, Strain CCAC1681" /LENGTH=143 /DNA_ID=CAMNT_0049747361 /DNA_START=30 /DNA_END=461 /DNA_ORIENTATION=+
MASTVASLRVIAPASVASKRGVTLRARAPATAPRAAPGRMMAISTETEAEAEVSKALKEGGVTVEYQRKKAKEMVKFFKQQQYNQAVEDSQVFGMTPKNEINNGRWTMFGLLVGMMTEYATGVDFIDQIKLTISVLGIADVYD